MIPLKCPICGLQWNVREDAPESVTCPMCLTAVTNPRVGTARPPPLPVLPLEHEVRRDTSAGNIGIAVVLLIVAFGVLTVIAAGISGAGRATVASILLGVIVVTAATAIIISLITSRKPAISRQAPVGVGQFQSGSVLDYQRPGRAPRQLSPWAFFAQTIGGIILGIIVTFFVTIGAARIGRGEATIIAIFIAPAVGIALCFLPKAGGLGLGLILALPVGALLAIGLCFVMLSKI